MKTEEDLPKKAYKMKRITSPRIEKKAQQWKFFKKRNLERQAHKAYPEH